MNVLLLILLMKLVNRQVRSNNPDITVEGLLLKSLSVSNSQAEVVDTYASDEKRFVTIMKNIQSH